MAKVERVAAEIMFLCANEYCDCNYHKLQALTYMCQCVHYARYGVPLFQEKFYFYNSSERVVDNFDICLFLAKLDKIIDMTYISDDDIISIKHIMDSEEWKRWRWDRLIELEKETIKFVFDKYSNKEKEELDQLIFKDPLFKKIKDEDVIEFSKLSNLFITESEKEEVSAYNKMMREKVESISKKMEETLKIVKSLRRMW